MRSLFLFCISVSAAIVCCTARVLIDPVAEVHRAVFFIGNVLYDAFDGWLKAIQPAAEWSWQAFAVPSLHLFKKIGLLKPEYSESYASDGMSLYARC